MNSAFWRSKSVLVTGGNGFLGTHLRAVLREHGAERVFAPRSSEFDLRDRGSIQAALTASEADVVIHLAAVVGGIGANRANPGRFLYENAIMGLQLMEEARTFGVQKFVTLGTVCSYPKFCPVPFREDDLWNGYPEETNAPYGLAKKLLLVQGQAYRAQYGFNAIGLIPVNLYGPGDNFDPETSHVIPALIRKCIEAREAGADAIQVWGTGSASREFLYVQDAARAIVLATERYDGEEPVNIGVGQEVTIRDLVDMIAAATGFQGGIHWDASRPDGQPRRALDTSRARDRFGFIAEMPLDEGIRRTGAWYEVARQQAVP